ncbi:hypothetical protein AVEN_230774-1 [Araneus ventricosus]|uniref:Uncharacterized protein n=1 Tax=Araneus ventricosus TaxID=182803 RepID=A0A4Y2A2M8_ARAVE|nr:hypothetical protein AVEN_230774-1 [Araneus ventricosus]
MISLFINYEHYATLVRKERNHVRLANIWQHAFPVFHTGNPILERKRRSRQTRRRSEGREQKGETCRDRAVQPGNAFCFAENDRKRNVSLIEIP